MRKQLLLVAAVLIFTATTVSGQTPSTSKKGSVPQRDDEPLTAKAATITPALAGTWKSTPEPIKLTSDFEVSVYGPGATSVRNVELSISPNGQGMLKVIRKVVDARGRTVAGSESIEEAQLELGASSEPHATRVSHAVEVVSAQRRYPDDPSYKWPIDGLKVKVETFADGEGNAMEIRFDTPEGKGSFWEMLKKTGRATTSQRASQ